MPKYPKKVGICQQCGGDIVAKNSSFDKPGRKFCSKTCHTTHTNQHRIWSERARQKLSVHAKQRMIGRSKSIAMRKRLSEAIRGTRHWNWQGGKTPDTMKHRGDFKLRMWSKAVLDRDKHTCQQCGTAAGLIDAHHIKAFQDFPELRFQVENGIALCRSCHAKADTDRRLGPPKQEHQESIYWENL